MLILLNYMFNVNHYLMLKLIFVNAIRLIKD